MNALSFTRNTVRTGTVLLMTGIVMVATADGFAQSYSGLYDWALQHRLSGWKAESFPLLVDLFILVGELGLFLLALDGHRLGKSLMAWIDVLIPAAVASVGWLVSLWFNVNHIQFASAEDKVTAGVPPVTAMVGLLILLRTVHRYMAKLDERNAIENLISVVAPEREPEPVMEPARKPVQSIITITRTDRRWGLRRRRSVMLVPIMPPVRPTLIDPETVQFSSPDLPADSEPEMPEPSTDNRPELASQNGRTNYGKGPDHPKWDEGVKLYRESLQGPGKAMSQRDLAAALGMRNRTLAAAIIIKVKEENDNGGTDNSVSSSTESAAS